MLVKDVLKYNRIIKAIIDNTTDVNALVKFKLLGMLKQFEPTILNYETIRVEKINEYGKPSDDGDMGIFPPKKEDFDNDDEYKKAHKEFEDTIKKFSDDLSEVEEAEADIEIKKFKYTDIMDAGLPADYLVAIFDLIEE